MSKIIKKLKPLELKFKRNRRSIKKRKFFTGRLFISTKTDEKNGRNGRRYVIDAWCG